MTVEMVTRTIQLILAPVVMVTACALILNGLVQRYGAINDRLRGMAQERIQLLRMMATSVFDHERLSEIDAQVPDLLRHHKLLRDALLMIYYAILAFVGNMFIIALAVTAQSEWIATAALVLFLTGTAVLLTGVLFAAFEVRSSHRSVQYEVRRVVGLSGAAIQQRQSR
jgi:hypothetical protein